MKKILASIIALSAISAAFTGCSRNNTGSSDNSGSSGSSGASSGESSSQSEPTVQRTATDIGNAAANCLEWVAMQEITDADNAMTMFGLDLSLCEEYYLSAAMMSAHLNEIIVVKPTPGNEPKVEAQLDEHFDYIKNSAAFYPAQELSAAGAVQGKTNDGFYYIIVHQIGSEIADVIKDYQPGDELPQLQVPEQNYGDNGITEIPPTGETNGTGNAGTGENYGSTGENQAASAQ